MKRKPKKKQKVEVYESKVDQVVYRGLLVFFFLLPLTMFPLTAEIFELPKVTLLRLFSIAILLLWAARSLQNGSLVFRRTFLDLPVLFYAAIAILATVFSINPAISLVGGYYRYEGLPTILFYVLIFFAVTNFVGDSSRGRSLLYVLLAGGTLSGAYGIFQHFGLDFVRLTGKVFELSRSSGTFGNPIFLGAFLILMIPIAVSMCFSAVKPRERVVLCACILILLVSLIFTQTRGAWLGLAVSFAASLLVLWRKGTSRRSMIVAVVLGAVVVAVLLSAVFAFESGTTSTIERVLTAFRKEGSVATRLDMWTGAMKLVRDRPTLGYGWETFEGTFPKYGTSFLMSVEELPDRPHNGFLYLGSSAGLLGWLAWLWVVVTAIWKTAASPGSFQKGGKTERRSRKTSAIASDKGDAWILVGLLAAVVGYIVQEQFSFSLAGVTPVFWALLGLAALLVQERTGKEHVSVYPLSGYGARIALVAMSLFVAVVGAIFTTRFFIADYHFRTWQGREALAVSSDRALNSVEKAVELNPYVSKYRRELIQAYAGQSAATGDRQWTELALQVAEEGLSLNPRDEALWISLGDLNFYQPTSKASYGEALSAYERVLELHPESAAARWAVGDVYLATGEYGKAVQELERAAKLVPHHAGVLYSLGSAYEKARNLAEARAAFQRVLSLEPDHEEAKRALRRLTR